MDRRIAASLVAGALALLGACGDPTGAGDGPVRFRAIDNGALVLYSAPPVRELRRFALTRGDTTIRYLRNHSDGGFYALAGWQTAGVSQDPSAWELVRYDSDWERVASRRGNQLVTDSTMIGTLRLTADHSRLVAQLFASSGGPGTHDLLVLDPVTLQVQRRIAAGERDFLADIPGPTAEAGTEILWRNDPGNCQRSLVWFDVVTLTVADSVQFSCSFSFRGARTRHQLYLYDMQHLGGGALRLVDVTTGQVLASAPDTLFPFRIIADSARGQLLATEGGLIALDPVTLATRDVILFQAPGEPPVGADSGVVHQASHSFVAGVGVPGPPHLGFPVTHRVAIVDLARGLLTHFDIVPQAIVPIR